MKPKNFDKRKKKVANNKFSLNSIRNFFSLNSISVFLSILFRLIVLGLILYSLNIFCEDLDKHVILIKQISIPDSLKEKGYTSTYIAEKIAVELYSIETSVPAKYEDERGLHFQLISEKPEIKITNSSLDYNNLVQFFKVKFKKKYTQIKGAIVEGERCCKFDLNIVKRNQKQDSRIAISGEHENIEGLAKKIAIDVLKETKPKIFLSYSIQNTHENCNVHINDCDYSEIIEHIKKITDSSYKNQLDKSVAFFSWGYIFHVNKKYEEAIEKYEKALQLKPKYPGVLVNQAIVKGIQKNYQESNFLFHKAINEFPNNPSPHVHFGISLERQKKYVQAINHYIESIKIKPTSLAYNSWGVALLKGGNPVEAIAKYERAIQLDSKNFSAYDNWGVALFRIGEYERALEKHEMAEAINPKYPNLYVNWGVVLQKLGYFEKAIKKYERAINLNPQYANAYFNFGATLEISGRSSEALKQYEKVVELGYEDWKLHSNWGIALNSLGRYEEAVVKFRKAIEYIDEGVNTNKARFFPFNGLGWSFYNLHHNKKAITYFRKSLEIDPQQADSYFGLGRVFLRQKAYGSAIDKFKKAIDKNPSNKLYKDNLANALLAQRNQQKLLDSANELIKKKLKIN